LIKKQFLLLLIIIGVPTLAVAGSVSSSFIFLRVGCGSRPVALSEAVTASSTDITTAFYNPAALNSFAGNNQVAFMYNSYFKDVSQGFLAAGFKMKNRVIGLYISSGNISNIDRRGDVPTPDPLGQFEENNLFAAGLYAQKIGRVNLGLAFKYAYEKIDYGSADAAMIDVGGQMPVTGEFTAGLALKNIGSKPKFVDTSYDLPRDYRFGLSYKPTKFQGRLECLSDLVLSNDSRPKYNFGIEYSDQKFYAIRAGYGFPYDSRSISLGGGLNYHQFKIDYAFVPYKHDLGNTHRFTLIATF
jgi:hypothetical protein